VKAAWLLLLAACSTEDNLGNHVFGDARWSIAIGSSGEERATALAIDTIGNVIVAGTCDGVIELGTTRVDCHGSFITSRATDTGRELWTVVLHNAVVTSLDVDENAFIIATGSYSGNANVAGTQLTTAGTDPFVAVFDGTGALEGVAPLGVVGTAVSPVGTIQPDGCIYVTGGFHGTMPTPDGAMTNDSGELDGYVSDHFANGDGDWFVPLSGDGDQVGRALAVNGERLAVLVQSSGPMFVGAQPVSAPAWPATVLAQFAVNGELLWTRALAATSEHIAVSRSGTIVVTERDTELACPRMRGFDVAGTEQWTTPCEPSARVIDAVHVGAQGTIVTGGRTMSPDGGELFLAAHDEDGAPLGSIESPAYPYAHGSSLDGIAIEPTGEVAFIATVNHRFDFGNGMLPFEGAHDAVIVKLDSPRGHDGPVVLLRE
jgi:hypothetical protein